jgi:hypothetical protein
LRYINAVKQDLPLIRFDLTTDQPQQCRFTDPARPHQCGNFTFRNIQTDIVVKQPFSMAKTQAPDLDQ